MKIADVDIDPFSDHDKTDAQPDETGETISLIPGGGATWEPEREQETSFGRKTQRTRLKEVLQRQEQVLKTKGGDQKRGFCLGPIMWVLDFGLQVASPHNFQCCVGWVPLHFQKASGSLFPVKSHSFL